MTLRVTLRSIPVLLGSVLAALVLATAWADDAAAAGGLEIVTPVRIDAAKGLYPSKPLQFSYTVRNASSAPVYAQLLIVPIRDSAGTILDAFCQNGGGVTIAPGQTWTCTAPVSAGYGAPGTYTYGADWQTAAGVWHPGELGATQTFTLSPLPLTTLAGASTWPLGEQTLGSDGPVTSVPITNTGGGPLLIDAVTLGGAEPGDFSLTGESCTQAAVAPGATCVLSVRFSPTALGPRSATIVLDANTSPGRSVVNLTATGVAPAPPQSAPTPTPGPAAVTTPAPLDHLAITLAYTFRAGSRSTRFSSLTVKGLPAGAKVSVRCPRGCSRRSLTSAKAAHGTLSLKPLIKRTLKVGTRITVDIVRPGFVGAVKVLTVRARRAPAVTTSCLPPGTSKPVHC